MFFLKRLHNLTKPVRMNEKTGNVNEPMSTTKQFAKYVSQNIFGMLGVSCYIIADTFFISKAAGANGITVLNLALPVYNLIFAIGSMLGVGSATRFAILRAQGEKQAEAYFSNAVGFACIIGFIFVLAGIFIPDKILAVMGGDEEIIALGTGYTRIFLLFAPFFMLNYIVSAFVRNDHAPALAMLGTMAGSLSNILFDYILMFPMKMGLEGAALATAASPIISILICTAHFWSKNNTLKLSFQRLSLRRLLQSCQLGMSAFIGELSSGVTTTVFNYLILGIAGNIGVAAYGVVANFALIATAVFNGIAQGTQPLVSDYFGQGKRQEVKKLLRLSIQASLAIAVIVYILVFAATDVLVSLFNSEQSRILADYAFSGMRLYFAGFFLAGINIVGAGFLSATERARAAFGISVVRGVLAIVGCSLLLSCLFGFTGVWISFAAAEGITVMITVRELLKER